MATKYWISTSSTSFNTAANWSDGNAPANDDVLCFDYRGTANVETNLSTVLTGIVIRKEKSYTGRIGVLSSTGSTATYLVLDGGTLHYEQDTGAGVGSGSPLCMINFGGTAAVANVYDSASSSYSTYLPPLLLKGTSLTLHMSGGKVAVAPLHGETSTGTFRVFKNPNAVVAPSLFLGSGVTTTALTVDQGASCHSRAGQTVTSAIVDGTGSLYTYDGSGAHTALTVGEGAKCIHYGTGTITTLNLSGTFDRTRDTRALTLSTSNIYGGSHFLLDNGVSGSTTRSTKNFVKCSIQDVEITLPLEEQF